LTPSIPDDVAAVGSRRQYASRSGGEEMDLGRLTRNVASGDRARLRMQQTGFTPNGHPLWSPPETVSVRYRYPNYDAILAEVRRRTRRAAHSKASRLGISRTRALPWSDGEISVLRREYPRTSRSALLAQFPGRSWSSICAKARERGLRRARRSFARAITPLANQILDRARELNWTLIDIDAAVRAGPFFTLGKHRTQKPNASIMRRAVQSLGGHVRAVWTQ
jgi:hypothetical protein